jgi:hypothetical protein
MWLNMLKRCYCEKAVAASLTYSGCEVDERWHDFQNFGDWAVRQTGIDDGWHLDKDLLTKGNKIYSPDTCIFIPHKINSLIISCKRTRGNNPIGVYWDEDRGLYQAYLTARKKRVHLGRWPTAEQAFNAYKIAKEAHIKEIAKEWRDKIDPRAYNALMQYEVEITD